MNLGWILTLGLTYTCFIWDFELHPFELVFELDKTSEVWEMKLVCFVVKNVMDLSGQKWNATIIFYPWKIMCSNLIANEIV
jgi:hypothetical protein